MWSRRKLLTGLAGGGFAGRVLFKVGAYTPSLPARVQATLGAPPLVG